MFVGLEGNPGQLYTLVSGDFKGDNSFIYWIVAMLFVGMLGYVDSLRGLSRLFTVLVILTLFLDNGGFFQQFTAFLNSTKAAPANG